MKSGEFTSVAAQVGCLRYSDREPADRRRFPLAAPLTASRKVRDQPPRPGGTSSAGAQGRGSGAQGRAGQAVRVADAAAGLELPESGPPQVG